MSTIVKMPRKTFRTTNKASWTAEELAKAIEAVKEGTSIRQAAKQFGIPAATLHGKLKSGLEGEISGPKMGRKPVLSASEEHLMAESIKMLSKLFYGLTPHQLRSAAYAYAEQKNLAHSFNKEKKCAGRDWLQGFMRRNPSISVRKPEATSINRITAFNRQDVKLFYDNLESVMHQYVFPPSKIFNVDETGITNVQEPGIILAEKGEKRVGSITSGERGKNVTVVCAMNASGTYIPPMFIFPRKRMSPQLASGGPVDAIYHCSSNGWINDSLFLVWLQHFNNHAKPSKEEPCLLILDNHASHISLDSYEYCREHGIIMLSLPPHTSHRMQPLDVTFYGPLKKAYRKQCDFFMRSKTLLRITHYDLAAIFNAAYTSVADIEKAVSGFRCTGICPMKRALFTDQDFLASDMLLARNAATGLITAGSDALSLPLSASSQEPILYNIEDIPVVIDNSLLEFAESIPDNVEEIEPSNETEDFRDHTGIATVSQNLLNLTSNVLHPVIVENNNVNNPAPPKQRRKKQHSIIITSSPVKEQLLEKKKRQASKENVEEKTRKRKKSLPTTEQLAKRKKTKEMQLNPNVQSVVKNKNAKKTDDKPKNKRSKKDRLETCSICNECGEKEPWYICGNCGTRAHAQCTDAEYAEQFICDKCL